MKRQAWATNLMLLLLSFAASSSANLCSRGFSKDQREKFFHLRCHCATDGPAAIDDYEEIMMNNFNLLVTDESSAVVQFSFPPNPCIFQRYNIELNYVNLTSVEECSSYHPENHTLEDEPEKVIPPLRHSLRKYFTSNESSYGSQCPERPLIEFHHIFTGCYYVMITPYESGIYEGHKKAVFSKPIYLDNGLSKADLELMNGTVTVNSEPGYLRNSTHITTRFMFNERSLHRVPTIASVSLKFNILNLHGESVCTRSGIEYDCCEIMNDDNSTYTCTSDIQTRSTECTMEKGDVFGRIECSMPINFVGNYCVLLEIKDDRCPSGVGDVWSVGHDHNAQSCIWHHKGFAPVSLLQNDLTKHNASSPHWYVWLILSLVIVGVLGFLFYYFYVLLRRGLLGDEAPEDEEEGIDVMTTALPLLSTDTQKILLLYARDCEKFMDLMENFREILADTCKKEVIDIYNEMYEQEINEQGMDFVLNLLKRNRTYGKELVPEVIIVMVLTECGLAHHQAQLRGTRLEYKEQEALDSYFPFALKALKEDTNTANMYNRVHVVEFTSFKVPPKSPEIFINALTRYKLPKHFKELVRALIRANNKTEIDVCEDSLQLLGERIDNLVSYKKENPDYMVSLVAQVATNGATTQLSEK